MKKIQFIIIAILLTVFAVSCCPKECDAQVAAVQVKPMFQIDSLIDIYSVTNPEIGIFAVHLDSIPYYYSGEEWYPLASINNYNTQCCPMVRYHNFLGEPTQELFEQIFGHSNENYIGSLYAPVQDKAWSFTYLTGITGSNWKWIALKD